MLSPYCYAIALTWGLIYIFYLRAINSRSILVRMVANDCSIIALTIRTFIVEACINLSSSVTCTVPPPVIDVARSGIA